MKKEGLGVFLHKIFYGGVLMNQFAKRERAVLFLLLGMLVFGSFAGCDMNGDGGSGDAPFAGTVWNELNNDGSATKRFSYFTGGKLYQCEEKDGQYWSGEEGKKRIDDYTLSGNKLKIGSNTFTVSISGDVMTATSSGNTLKAKKVTSPSAAQVKAGAAKTEKP